MKLALTARVKCDPKHILENRWVHDAAHVIADSRRRARKHEEDRKNRKH
jgi:hypothetical protein